MSDEHNRWERGAQPEPSSTSDGGGWQTVSSARRSGRGRTEMDRDNRSTAAAGFESSTVNTWARDQRGRQERMGGGGRGGDGGDDRHVHDDSQRGLGRGGFDSSRRGRDGGGDDGTFRGRGRGSRGSGSSDWRGRDGRDCGGGVNDDSSLRGRGGGGRGGGRVGDDGHWRGRGGRGGHGSSGGGDVGGDYDDSRRGRGEYDDSRRGRSDYDDSRRGRGEYDDSRRGRGGRGGFNDSRRGHSGEGDGGRGFPGRRVTPGQSGPSQTRSRPVVRSQQWTFWTLLCGSADSQVVFTEFKGYCASQKLAAIMERGYVQVPLFQPASDEEICERFKVKLLSIAAAVAQCQELTSRLMLHLRIGDLYLVHKYFKFGSRPGPRLGDFNQLLEDRSFSEARERLEQFFSDNDYERNILPSTFVTEKSCGSHATIEMFLDLHGFEANPEDEFFLSATLNGAKNKFEMYYNLKDLSLNNIQLFMRKWNLNLVTAKGTNYQGTFREKADLRVQLDASYGSDADERVERCVVDEGFEMDSLRHLFERIGGDPPVPESGASVASVLAAPESDSERAYRLRLPELAQKIEYFREQHNRAFVRRHDRWPLVVHLRQFKFFNLAKEGPGDVFHGQKGIEFRVTAMLDCQLDREVLEEPAFVSYVWECCQLMQELVATSLEA